MPVRDGRTKARSLGSSVEEENGSDLVVSLWRDDDAKISGAMMALSELQAHDVVVRWEPCELHFERSEKTPLREALLTGQHNPCQPVSPTLQLTCRASNQSEHQKSCVLVSQVMYPLKH